MYRLLVLSVICGLALALPGNRQKREDGDNPCTQEALAAEQFYFAVAGDDTQFIECDLLGHANVLACPDGLVWDESRLSCVYRFTVSGSGTNGGNNGGNTGTDSGTTAGPDALANPCTQEAIAANKLFFPHPDPTKFIQCDLWGDAYFLDCPSGLVWNKSTETCASAFFNPTSASRK